MRLMQLGIVLFGVIFLANGCSCQAAETVHLGSTTKTDPVLAFAMDELTTFGQKDGGVHCLLEVDASVEPYVFGWEVVPYEGGQAVRLFGHDSTCVLHAVYAVLEKAGYVFDMTGPVAPKRLDWSAVLSTRQEIHPVVLRRGIRQHINFPMDISSYPLEEAKAYIRNLARMRFNYIMFHSYPNQWIAVDEPDFQSKAGSFFYGQRHDVPDHPLLKRILRNEKTFCIPEIEPVFEDKPERSRQAVAWLRAVMAEAKRVGMAIEFSFELRKTGTDFVRTLAKARAILTSYPDIDTLELITQETGGWGPTSTLEELQETVKRFYGESTLSDPAISPLIKGGQNDINQLFGELGHNIAAVKQLKADYADRKLDFRLGVYCSIAQYLKACVHLMRQFTPEGVGWAILPGHSSTHTVHHMRKVDFGADDWKRTMMISWIEFDGIMYLQQNSLEGIRDLILDVQKELGPEPLTGIVYNHWRNAESRTPARYAAVTALDGPMATQDFYRQYGRSLGVVNLEGYIQAMQALDTATVKTQDLAPNVGFCFVGVWGQGLGLYGNWKTERVVQARQLYETALELLQAAGHGTTTAAAQDYLRLIENRVRTTVLYLKGVEKGTELKAIINGAKPKELTAAQKEQVVQTCNMGLEYMEQFMTIYAERLDDRGVEGNLISFYYTPMAILKRIRSEYGGVAETVPPPHGLVDAPPPPMHF